MVNLLVMIVKNYQILYLDFEIVSIFLVWNGYTINYGNQVNLHWNLLQFVLKEVTIQLYFICNLLSECCVV